MLYFTTESKKNQLITDLSKNLELFAGLFNLELIVWLWVSHISIFVRNAS